MASFEDALHGYLLPVLFGYNSAGHICIVDDATNC